MHQNANYMKHLLIIVPVVMLLAGCAGSDLSKATYKNPDAPVEKRVADLLSRMTLEEKILQLSQGVCGRSDNVNNIGYNPNKDARIGSVICGRSIENSKAIHDLQQRAKDSTRLGIPVLVGYDVIHGEKTTFPIPLAQGASFNPALAEQACSVAAREAYEEGIDWTFSPMIDICHDPRWGRVMESYGEDPYVNSVFCVGAVRGYQGDDLSKPGTIAACLKHYVGYGATEAGRDYFASDMSRQVLWDTYLQPYEAGVKAGAATMMSSFNTLCGIPGSANPYTLTEIRKNKWGHKGFVVSDWGAVQQTIRQGAAADRKEACRICFNAGVEMDMCDWVYLENMEQLIDEGAIRMKDVDEAVRRILTLKFQLGLFENPVREVSTSDDFFKPEYLSLAEQFARESMVLLKNTGVLPLKKDARIALVGPVATDKKVVLGNWSAACDPEKTISILEGMQKEFGNVKYAPGCGFEGDDRSGFAAAKAAALFSDVVVLCLGEGYKWTGENQSRGRIILPDIQLDLYKAMLATGKPVIVIIESGRPLDLTMFTRDASAIMDMWCPGTCGGPALAGLLSGRYNPSGKLPITFPNTLQQVPIYYNYRDRARGGDQGIYKDGTSLEPLYPFGYGLSYSSFEYSEPEIDGLTAKVKVTNTSDVDGMETVLWFIRDPYCSITRPVKELKFFEKKLIKAGETLEFTFTMDKMRDLGFVDHNGDRFFEGGEFRLFIADKTLTFNIE